MPEIEYSVTINRPIGEVFRYAMDTKSIFEWQKDVKDVYFSEEKLRTGAMITQDRSTRLLRWRLDFNVDVLTYQTNRMLEYKGVLGRFPIRGSIEFDGLGGSTAVTEKMNIRMGLLYGLFSPLMRGVMTRRTRKVLEQLKSNLENRSATQPASTTDFHKDL